MSLADLIANCVGFERRLLQFGQSRIPTPSNGCFGSMYSDGMPPLLVTGATGSYEILHYLVDRLPLMITPRWVSTESQPIAIRNVLDYLVGVLGVPAIPGRQPLSSETGGAEGTGGQDEAKILPGDPEWAGKTLT